MGTAVGTVLMKPAAPHGLPVHTAEDDYWQSTPEPVGELPDWFTFRRHPSLGNVPDEGDRTAPSEAEKHAHPEASW